jgi:hypothetical protein
MEQNAMIHHRARAFQRWLGPWRQKRDHAIEDAIATGHAIRERPDEGGRVFLGVGAEIVSQEGYGPDWPAWARADSPP